MHSYTENLELSVIFTALCCRVNKRNKMQNHYSLFVKKSFLISNNTSCRSRFRDSTSCECFASASIELMVLSTMRGLVGPSQTLEFAEAGCVESSE